MRSPVASRVCVCSLGKQVMRRQPGLSVRLKLTLSYAAFLMLAGTLLLAAVWLFLLRYVPEQAVLTVPNGTAGSDVFPVRSRLLDVFAPRAAAVFMLLLIFGLLGGLMYYSRRGGSSLMRSALMGYIMSAVVMGILMPGIDNWAHAGGFAGGYLAGILLDPLKPERVDHMVMAGVCLAASAIAVAASVLVSIWPLIMIRFFGAPPGIVR